MPSLSGGNRVVTDRGYRALSGYLIGLAVLQIAALSLSVARIPVTRGPALAILVLALAGAGASFRLLPGRWAPPAPPPAPPRPWLTLPVVLGGAATFLLLAFAAYVAPDLSWDGNLYHLPTLQFWAQEGFVHWVDERFRLADLANGYPKGAELVGFLLVRAFGDTNLVNTFNLVFVPLGVLGIASLARTVGVSRPGALAASAAYLLVPVNIAQSGTTYVDASYGAAVIAFLAVLMHAIHPAGGGERLAGSEAPPLAAALGLACSIRPTGLLLVPLLCAAVAGRWWLGRRALPSRLSAWKATGFLLAVLAGASAAGGYWYARNFRMTGDPLYPLGVRIGGWTVLSGRPLAELIFPDANAALAHLGTNRPMQVLRAWSQGLTDWPESIRGADSRAGGLGFLWIAGGVPALGWILLRAVRSPPERSRLRPVLLLALMVAVLFVLTPMRWWARYTVWLYGLGLPALALALQEIGGRLRRPRLAGGMTALLVLVTLAEGGVAARIVLGSSYPGPRPVRLADLFHRQAWRWPDNYLLKSTRGTLLDEVAAGDENVAVGPLLSPTRRGLAHALVYGQLANPLGRRRVVPIGDPISRRDRDAIRSGSVHYILWDGIREPPLGDVSGLRAVRAAGLWILVLPASGLPEEGASPGAAAELHPRR